LFDTLSLHDALPISSSVMLVLSNCSSNFSGFLSDSGLKE
jgi:hypothetical protein